MTAHRQAWAPKSTLRLMGKSKKPKVEPGLPHLQAWRKHRNLTQEQLAEALGVTQGAVSQWENRTSDITLSKIAEIARVLHTSIERLMFVPPQASDGLDKVILSIPPREYARAIRVLKSLTEPTE